MTDVQRDAFPNLLLLCLVHHTRVDGKNKKDYKPETLHKWKADREAEGQDALAGLTRLTEEDLQVIIIDAFQEQTQHIVEVLDRLENNDKEAADLLRKLLNELQEFREYSTLLDPDSAVKLYHASLQLADLNLAGNARQLSSVSAGLMDTTAALKEQIDRLGGMEGQWR
jgi:ATP-dependent exoDNAse (exonuclease V) alpha subunit